MAATPPSASPVDAAGPLPEQLGLEPFRPRAPWWGGDLQTLRDTLRPVPLPPERGEPIEVAVAGGHLLALLDRPPGGRHPLALVLLLHGLGGGSSGEGLRRMGQALQQAGFAVLRLNLRGAWPSRSLAPGSYAAACGADLAPVLERARRLAAELAGSAAALPLLGIGLSLGGTILLNVCLDGAVGGVAPLDGLVCISSPLDLAACSRQIERPRNRLYQRWLLRRLRAQILADPFGLAEGEHAALTGSGRPRTIRAFDAAITAPRWGYDSVDHYYAAASPLLRLLARLELPAEFTLPPALLVQALDDPWVPAASARALATALEAADPVTAARFPRVLLTSGGGHNGFHGVADGPEAAWADRLTALWFRRLVGAL